MMTRQTLLTGLAFAILQVPAAAQTADDTVNPGMIGPDSRLYGIEVAVDAALVDWGIANPGEVAHERASEVHAAFEEDDSEAANDALNELHRVASVATQNHSDGLTKAAAVLEATQEIAPDEAGNGLEAATDHVQEAQERRPEQRLDELPKDVDRPSVPAM